MKQRIAILTCILGLLLSHGGIAGATDHKQALDRESTANTTIQVVNEYSMLMTLKEVDDAALYSAGYTVDQINVIKSEGVDAFVVSELMERAKLSDEILFQKGYTEEEIEELRSLDGDESISELSSLAASVTIYNSKNSFFYDSNRNLTFSVVNVTWTWNKEPIVHATDILGAGWAGNYQLTNYLNSYNNQFTLNCVGNGYSIAPKTATARLTSCNINAGKFDIAMRHSPYPNDNDYFYWVKSGSGMVELSIYGFNQNTEFIAKYGHTSLGISPSISTGGSSLSFGFNIDTFTPASGAVYGLNPETRYMSTATDAQ